MVADALRRGEEQHAARFQRVVKRRNDAVLQLRFQIDHQVAAAEQVQLGERRVLDDVLGGEYHHFPDLFLHTKAGIFLDEETAQPLRRDIHCDVGWIETGAGAGNESVDRETARMEEYLDKARELSDKIPDPDDKKQLLADLDSIK